MRGRPPPKKPIMCKYIKTGGCSKEGCPFAHDEEEIARPQVVHTEEEGEEARPRGSRGARSKPVDDDAPHRRPEKGRPSARNRLPNERQPRRQSWRENANTQTKPIERDVEIPAREPPLPRDSISRSTLQQMSNMVQCRHASKGCSAMLSRDELTSHLEKCAFERCKEQLANCQTDPIIKYFKKQIAERDKLIQELRLQSAQSFKEEEEKFGIEEEQVSLFKDLVFKTTNAMKIAAIFGEKYPTAEWSVFFHHVSESDLSYVYDGYLQWVYKGRRYILIKLNKPDEEGFLL